MTIRVLHVISSLDLRTGGPAVAVEGLAIGQQRAGLDTRVVATFREGESRHLEERMRGEGISVTRVGPCSGRLVRHHGLGAVIDESVAAVDVVHVHALFEEVQHLAARSARLRGTPYVVRPCGMLDRWSLRQNWFVKRAYMAWRLTRMLREAAAIHYTTELERQGAAHLTLAPRAIVESNGVNLAEHEALPAPGAFRDRHGVPRGAPLVLFVGRVHPGKGVELLVPALAACGVAEARLAVVGPDSEGYLARMRLLAERCGVADRVVFTGLLGGAERVAALVDADVFALPSEHENFGIAVAEAMAAGKPVIVSPQVGIAADVTSAGAGGVTPLEAPALGAELTRWLCDATLRSAAGARARAFALVRYNWNDIGRRWRGHYESLLARPVAA